MGQTFLDYGIDAVMGPVSPQSQKAGMPWLACSANGLINERERQILLALPLFELLVVTL
jgi:hypothetical protein